MCGIFKTLLQRLNCLLTKFWHFALCLRVVLVYARVETTGKML